MAIWNDEESAKLAKAQLKPQYDARMRQLQQDLYSNLYLQNFATQAISGVAPQLLREPQPLPTPVPESAEDVPFEPIPYPTIDSVRDRERAVLEFKFKCIMCGGLPHITKTRQKYCIAYDLEEPALLCDERE